MYVSKQEIAGVQADQESQGAPLAKGCDMVQRGRAFFILVINICPKLKQSF